MHYRIFDLWRFAAAIAIMLYHFLYFAPFELWRHVGPLAQRPTGLLDLFFMISGFLVMARYGAQMSGPADMLRLLRRRLAALYPLHLVTTAFFLPVAMAGAFGWIAFHNPERWDLAVLPMHLLLLHAWGTTPELAFNLPSWSVSAEFFCYLAFPAILLLARRWGTKALAGLLVAWVAVLDLAWSAELLGETHWSRANLFGAYRALVGFLIGCMIAEFVHRRRVTVPGGFRLSAALILAGVAAMLVRAPALLPLALLAAGLTCAAAAERANPASTKGLAPWLPLFQLSLAIYLWHMVLAAICYQLLWKVFLPDASIAAWLLFSIVPVVATLLASALSQPFQAAAYRRLAGPRQIDEGSSPTLDASAGR